MPIMAAIPALKLAAPFILKGLGKFFGGRGKIKAAKEAARAEKEQIENRYKSDFDTFENKETGRQARMQFISQQLTGARALSPEVIAAAMKRRSNTAYKGAVQDKSKGMGTAMLGEAVGDVGDLVGKFQQEQAIEKLGGGGGGGGIVSQSSQVKPVSFGGKTFDFAAPSGCPEGAIC